MLPTGLMPKGLTIDPRLVRPPKELASARLYKFAKFGATLQRSFEKQR
jgi:hypothetical protein